MRFLKGFLVAVLFVAFSCSSVWCADVDLPDNMVWSCYDVGSSGYVQASAVANAFLKQYDLRVRLIPSGTSIGRITPLVANRASVGFLANEAFFASQGMYDFASYAWGPQELRAVLGRPTSFPLITTQDSGIKQVADLKGRKVSWVVGNPSLNVKMQAILAFANLTWDDVEKVEFPGYSASLKALLQGNVDAAVGSTTASVLYELESSAKGVYYPELSPEDEEGWKRLRKYIPFGFPYKESLGAGIDKEKPLWLLGYRYPVVTVKADADTEFVYNFTKAMDEAYPLYKDAASSMAAWKVGLSAQAPVDVPFHPGAIKYFQEKGLWTAKHQAWNDDSLRRLGTLREKWDTAVKESQSKKMQTKAFKEFWMASIQGE